MIGEYWYEFYEVFVTATVENNGKRQENVANEMFSCLHHLARGLATTNDACSEITKAKSTHVKRATLDAYKIAINSYLESDSVLSGLLDYVLISDMGGGEFFPVVQEAKELGNVKLITKKAYREAKLFEAHGKFDESIEKYNSALENAIQLQRRLRNLESNPLVMAAVAREGRHRDERAEDRVQRKKDRWVNVALSFMTAIIGAVTTVYVKAYFDSSPVASTAASIPSISSLSKP